jgi:hypothetical protein
VYRSLTSLGKFICVCINMYLCSSYYKWGL